MPPIPYFGPIWAIPQITSIWILSLSFPKSIGVDSELNIFYDLALLTIQSMIPGLDLLLAFECLERAIYIILTQEQ